MENKRRKKFNSLHTLRKIHRITGGVLFLSFIIISISGLLLIWKKHSNGIILPKSYEGSSADLKDWLSLDSLHKNALAYLHDSVNLHLSTDLERIDVRKDKGMVKFVFIENYVGLQLDGATGKLLQIETRRSDLIENIHDGSILDYVFKTKNEILKLIYGSTMGLALLMFAITGFWLRFGPKILKKAN